MIEFLMTDFGLICFALVSLGLAASLYFMYREDHKDD